jgi:hypothetical protein
MTTLAASGDSIEGERIVCELRKMMGPWLIAKTSAHRGQRIRTIGFPATAWVEKPLRPKA